ncbi:MAG: Glyoxalase-like domain protein [Mucilaginibacter sp.]|nr:Glyoxalase-like domain protein [Mucilaginibacter sp.]MDB5139115.1 Glyoxalase-like domain protein [Mucilaginibacter sp.]
MYKALHLSPMIPSYNIKETASFFIDLLGFDKFLYDENNYVILHKDNLTIHILNAGTDIGEMEFYLEVDELDVLWNSIKDKLSNIKVRAPFDREYGMRELHIIIPQTKTLLFIGEVIKRAD